MKNKKLVLAAATAILAAGVSLNGAVFAADAPKAPAAKAGASKMSCNGKNGCSSKVAKESCNGKNGCASKDAKESCNGKDHKASCKANKAASANATSTANVKAKKK